MQALAALTLLLAGDVDSGPEKGAKVPELKVYDVTGPNKEKTVDYADLLKEKVCVFLLVANDKFDRPMNRFMKKIDEKLAADFDGVQAVAVFMTDDEEAVRTRLGRVQMSVNYEKTALSTFKGKDGPKGWNANSDAHITVIVASKGKVVARFGYKSVNDEDVPAVLEEVKKLVKK
jgi:hypothetical protein